MQPAVEIVVAGSYHDGRLWRHAVFVASKRARRLVSFQAEASPQQAESLAAGVRTTLTNPASKPTFRNHGINRIKGL